MKKYDVAVVDKMIVFLKDDIIIEAWRWNGEAKLVKDLRSVVNALVNHGADENYILRFLDGYIKIERFFDNLCRL